MNEVMTWPEIEAAFDSEWILVDATECTRSHEIIKGRVVFHSPDRKEVYRKLKELPRLHHAVRYIGKHPKDIVFAL